MLSAPPQPVSPLQTLAERTREAAPTGFATLAEIFADSSSDGAPTGFVLSQLAVCERPVLWVQDRLTRRESGMIAATGLPPGLRLVLVEVNRPVDVLWAMEQGLCCTALSAVVGEIHGEAPALDFTASKRLALRAEAHRVPGWLIRRGAQPALSAARCRWRVTTRPSPPHPYDAQAPGRATWNAELFRNRHGRTGEWLMQWDGPGAKPQVQGLLETPNDLPLPQVAA